MLLLTSASFPRYGLERFFAFAREAGFDGVEIQVNHNFDTQSPTYLKKLQDEYGVAVKAFSLPDRGAEKYMAAFQETAKHFPECHMNLSSPELFSFAYRTWVGNTVPKLAKKYNLHFNRRNTEFKMLLGFIPLRSENSLYSLKKAGPVSLDVSALWSSNQELMRSVGFLGGHLKHVYLSNVYKGHPYAPLDKGILPLESFLTKLAKSDSAIDFTLRINPRMLHEGDEESMLTILKSSKAFYDTYYKSVKETNA